MKGEKTDVAIIGAGPIGLELAAGLKRVGINYIHIEKEQIAQTITRFPPQTRFFSSADRIAIAGVPIQITDQPKCTREEYLSYLRNIVSQFGLNVRTHEPVTSLARVQEGGFVIRTQPADAERSYWAQNVVLAIGDLAGPRLLHIPGEDLPHVSHYLEETHKYFRHRVLIVGGKNSAVEAALRCYHVGANVMLSYRGDRFDPSSVKYWLLPEIEGRIRRGEIRAHFNTRPVAIHPTRVTLASVAGDETFDVPADFVLLLVGYVADMALFRIVGVELQCPNEAPVINEETMETNVPELYAAGTCTAGTQQRYSLFIENCHIHVERIVAALTGTPAPKPPTPFEQLEA